MKKPEAPQAPSALSDGAALPPVTRRRPGRPRADELQGEGLREEVIAAAARVYGVHGYRDASVELIAQAAGISRPLFYRLFKDRREVIDVVVGRANDALRAMVLQAMLPHGRLLPMLSAAIDAYFEWCRHYAAIAGSIYRELHDPESPASVHRTLITADLAALVKAKAQEQGRASLHPLMLDTLICAIEHVGSRSFWPQPLPDLELARHRAVIRRIALAAVAGEADQGDVPGLETVRD